MQEQTAVPDLETEIKQRDKEIAHNEHHRQVVSGVRISIWAVLFGVVVCAIVVAFVMMARK